MQDAYKAGKIDYFYLPTIENGKTDASEFCVNSGIGMAFNAKTFDAKPKTLYFTYWITMVKNMQQNSRCHQSKQNFRQM